MKDLATLTHYPPLEKLTEVLMHKASNRNPHFFRLLSAYYFTKLASMMQTSIRLHGGEIIPVNIYVINLAVSGSGKGRAATLVEEQLVQRFRDVFDTITLPNVAERNLANIALQRVARTPDGDPDDIALQVRKELEGHGPLLHQFDSGSVPALKQIRQIVLMSGIGSLNLEIDEIARNLVGQTDLLSAFLELYDVGKIKQKIIKSTSEQKRFPDIPGRTPTNMMLFGEPSGIIQPGSKVEAEFNDMLRQGYARRCFFGLSPIVDDDLDSLTPEILLEMRADPKINKFLIQLGDHLAKLADEVNHRVVLDLPKNTALLAAEYELFCRKTARDLPEQQHLRKTELQHRHSKAVKLAGTYAFIQNKSEISEDHLYYAIRMAEDSGEHFRQMLRREKVYESVAKCIVNHDGELTAVEIMDKVPAFRGNEPTKRAFLTQAMEYGYKNNMAIRKTFLDGIELYSGDAMQQTDLNEMIVSYSQDITKGFITEKVPFDKLDVLVTAPGYHYTVHRFKDGHRHADHMVPGFNLLVLDVDNSVSLDAAKLLLSDYQAIFATTKRHTPSEHRFRVILPLSHIVKLDPENFKRFMENVYDWLPFAVDRSAKDCARKWVSHKGKVHTQSGEMVDAMKFIPHTSAEEKQNQWFQQHSDLTNLERWFYANIRDGNRNNQILRYGLALIDNGHTLDEARKILHAFNKRLKNSLSETEINNTIMKTVVKHFNQKQQLTQKAS